jgi:hypothetical protein
MVNLSMNLAFLGLAFDIIGVFILTLVTLIEPAHTRMFPKDKWWIRYQHYDWRPLFIVRQPNEKPRLKFKWAHWAIVEGFISSKIKWNIIGLLCIFIGFLLQLKLYLP